MVDEWSSTALLAACALGTWLMARVRGPRAHLLYYVTAATFVGTILLRTLDVAEAVLAGSELRLAAAYTDDVEVLAFLARCLKTLDVLLREASSALGLTYDRVLRVGVRAGVCAVGVMAVILHYALSDRTHHVPPSPLKLLWMLLKWLQCAAMLVACVPIAVLRAIGRLLIGTAVLRSLYARGLVQAVIHRRSFLRSVRLRRECHAATTYGEWQASRTALDLHEGREAWASARQSVMYDYALVESALKTLERVREDARCTGEPHKLAELIMTLMNRSFANINDPHNHEFPGVGPPRLIASLLEQVEHAIDELVATR